MPMTFIHSKPNGRLLPALTAVVVIIATFAKLFVPFYLIGSTPIFVASCSLGIVLWRAKKLAEQAAYARDVLVALTLLYGVVIASFLIHSLHQVPVTHLLGISIFHGLFLLFGFAASRAPKRRFDNRSRDLSPFCRAIYRQVRRPDARRLSPQLVWRNRPGVRVGR